MSTVERMIKLLKVAYHLGRMPRGEGWVRASDFIYWGGISHSTTYRYIKSMEENGYLEAREYECRKLKCKEYRITSIGRDFYLAGKIGS